MVKRSLVASLVLVGACFGGGGGHAPAAAPPAHPVPKVADYTAIVADPLGFLPVDSELVLGLDVEQLRKSALWPMLEAKVTTTGGTQLSAFKQVCGFDPMTTIHGVTLGIKNLKAAKPEGVMVIHGLDRPQLMGCMAKSAEHHDGTVVIEDGIVVVGTKAEGNQVAFAFVDASTAVAVVGPAVGKLQLQGVLAAGVPLRTSAAFTSLVKLVDLEGSLWTVLNGSSGVFDGAASGLGVRPTMMLGSVTLASGLALNLRLRVDSASQAQQFQTMISGQLGSVRGMFDKVDVTTDAADVVFAVGMTEAQLTSIIQLAGGVLGAP